MTALPTTDLSSVGVDALISELEARLASASEAEAFPDDRWKAPSKSDVVGSVLRLLSSPRLMSRGGWPEVPRDKFEEIQEAVALIRSAVMEPDPDGDHVLRVHYEIRSEGYLAVQPITVPHEILTTEDLKTALYAMSALGSGIDRISNSVRRSFGYSLGEIVQTERGKSMLAAREDGKS